MLMDNESFSLTRTSRDLEVNSRGKKLTEFLSDMGLVILNGRTKEDKTGQYTFMGGAGTSVIDVAAVSFELLNIVKSFKVENQIFSDHMPITLNMEFKKGNSFQKCLTLLPKLQWNPQNVNVYHGRLDSEIQYLQERLTPNEINTTQLVNAIIKATAPSSSSNAPCYKNKWFDNQCLSARKRCFKLLNKFRKTNSEFIKRLYLKENKSYKILCKEKKNNYYHNLSVRLTTIKDSKNWWATSKEIRGKKYVIGTSISIEKFLEYFRKLLNPEINTKLMQYAEPLIVDQHLDKPIDATEVLEVLHKARDNKAPGYDRVTYEFFKNATPTFIYNLVIAFNNIYEGGIVPESFLNTIIFPIYKKGDPNEACNYRGLSFIDAVAKIFISILVNRLGEWERRNGVLTEFQAGFRSQYSTVDNIFNLVNIVSLGWSVGIKKIYGCFVDFKAAFDTVDREKLFYKLYSMGVSSKFIRILKSLYSKTKASVWNGTKLSQWFDTHTGLKQGCPASPMLFSLYTNDLHHAVGGGITVEDIHIRLLLYADDLVMLAENQTVLQKMIDNLQDYCRLWSLEINLSKTKIMIFRRGGRRAGSELWKLGDEPIEVVNSYKYLGITLTSGLSFKKHLEEKLENAKNAINITWSSFIRKKSIPHSAKFQLFNAVSRSIMCYGSQVWGYKQFEEVEKLVRYFLKKLIGLPNYTPNYVLSLELNVCDLYNYTLQSHFKYMLKIIQNMSDERLPKILAKKVIEKEISWFDKWKELGSQFDINIELNTLKHTFQVIAEKEAEFLWNLKIQKARQSIRHDYYNVLNYNLCDQGYFSDSNSLEKIRYILKCRAGLIWLNASPWRTSGSSNCSLCNRNEEENLKHFLAICPMLAEFRRPYLGEDFLCDSELLEILNGKNWEGLYRFLKLAINYRNMLIAEYNA